MRESEGGGKPQFIRVAPRLDSRRGRAHPAGMADFLHGTVHRAGEDLQAALRADPAALALWERLSPIGRNEFICWVEDAKQAPTRERRIRRTTEELFEGKKRPCCWAGCIHRDDKPPSRWQQAVLIDGKR
jgi:hypothetical protein